MSRSDVSSGATVGSLSLPTHSARSLICIAHASAMLIPLIFEDLANPLSRVPSHSGHVWNVTARSTNARTCGCIASRSLDSIDFCTLGIRPSNMTFTPWTLTRRASPCRNSCISFLVNLLIGLSRGTRPDSAYMRELKMLSAPQLGIVNGASASDFEASYSCVRSMSVTLPRPSQRVHMPPVRLKLAFTALVPAPRSTVIAPLALTDATLKENAFGEPMCGVPRRLNRMRSIAFAKACGQLIEA